MLFFSSRSFPFRRFSVASRDALCTTLTTSPLLSASNIFLGKLAWKSNFSHVDVPATFFFFSAHHPIEKFQPMAFPPPSSGTQPDGQNWVQTEQLVQVISVSAFLNRSGICEFKIFRQNLSNSSVRHFDNCNRMISRAAFKFFVSNAPLMEYAV